MRATILNVGVLLAIVAVFIGYGWIFPALACFIIAAFSPKENPR